MVPFNIDRSRWPPGPWHLEPDRVEWKTATGLPGLLLRNPVGAWCAYVGVPKEHALHGKAWRDLEKLEIHMEVHGGLTFAGPCEYPRSLETKWEDLAGERPDWWLFGFDACHYQDLYPVLARNGLEGWPADMAYRDQAYMTGQVEMLAVQLKAFVSFEQFREKLLSIR